MPKWSALVLCALGLVRSAEAKEPGLKPGEPAPAFTLKTANPELSKTKVFSLKSEVGKEAAHSRKWLLLSFSASYCAPCRKELEQLKALAPAIDRAGIGVGVVIIDTDEAGRNIMLDLVTNKLALPFPVLVDRLGILARRYRAESLPYLVVIDGERKVQRVHVGYEQDTLGELLAELGVRQKP